jgi:PAS domain S-box-containing protein
MRVRIWGPFLIAAVVATAVHVEAGSSPRIQAWLFLGLSLAEAVVVTWAILRRGLRSSPFWVLIALSFVPYLPANVLWYGVPVLGGEPLGYPSIADGLYIVAYLMFLAAVLALARRSERLDKGELIDASIVALAAVVVFWALVIDPAIDTKQVTGMGRLVTLAYPAVDIALAAVLGRTLASAHRRPPAFWLVAGSIAAQLAADLGYAAQTISGSFAYGRWVTAGYMLQYGLMGAAALHPSASGVSESVPGAGKSRTARQLLMGGALTIGPLLLLVGAVREDGDRAAVAVGGSILLAWLILRRMTGLMVTIEEHQETEERLRSAELRYRALVESVPGIVYLAGVGPEGAWSYVSPKISDVLGYTPEEWLAHPSPWTSHVHPDDLGGAVQDEAQAFDADRLSSLYRMVARDGRIVWIYDVASLVGGGDGEPAWQGLMTDITWMKEAEERLQAAGEERRRLLERLVTAQEEERTRLANDLHDDPIQKMTAAGLRLAALSIQAPEGMSEALDAVQKSVSDAIGRLRRLMFELRPTSLDRQGLSAALQDHLWDIASDGGFRFEITDRLRVEPDDEARSAMFRIAQEALANVRKHSGAKRVEVILETRDGGTLARVIDDGSGFSTNGQQDRGHLGLTSMRERAELLGGWCRISSGSRTGTTVEFWIPDRRHAEEPAEPLPER